MRLIDADALLDKAFGDRKGLIHTSDVKDAPTVEAIPVRRAHWTDVDGLLVCSACGRVSVDRHDEWIKFDDKTIIATVRPYYCSYCGAKMDEEVEG